MKTEEGRMSDARRMLATMMLGSMMSFNEYSDRPIDFDLMDEESEKASADGDCADRKSDQNP